jgi:hypothetical protein
VPGLARTERIREAHPKGKKYLLVPARERCEEMMDGIFSQLENCEKPSARFRGSKRQISRPAMEELG